MIGLYPTFGPPLGRCCELPEWERKRGLHGLSSSPHSSLGMESASKDDKGAGLPYGVGAGSSLVVQGSRVSQSAYLIILLSSFSVDLEIR